MHLCLAALLATVTFISVVARAASPKPTSIAKRSPGNLHLNEVVAERPTPQRISVTDRKRELTADGLGKFVAPNATSVNAACYPLYIEVFAPGPPRNLTAWYQKGTETFSQLNISVSATWERLSIGPGSLASIIVQGYLNDVAESTPLTVQPSNDRSCYNADFTGDASWGTTTGLGITTTFAPSVPNTYTESDLPTLIQTGEENTYRPTATAFDTAGAIDPTAFPEFTTPKRTSVTGPVVGAVLGTLVLVGIALGVWFWLRRKKRAERKRAGLGKGGATTAGDEAPYVVDLVGDEDGRTSPRVRPLSGGMREREGARPQLQAYTYGSSGQGTHDSSTPFMARGATSDENLRVHAAAGVVQERDSGMHFPVDTVPPDYADATATSSQDAGSTYFQSPSSHAGPNFARSPSASTPTEVSEVRRGSGKTMRG